ncbi:MAG TPA: DUF1844 domain-containing protein, partial [Acidobacteriaceae bacterium]
FRDASDEAPQPETPSNVTTMPAPEAAKPAAAAEPSGPEPRGESRPKLTLVESPSRADEEEESQTLPSAFGDDGEEMDLPGAPTAEELRHQKAAYDQAAERIDDLIRAQNPGAPPMEKVGFEHLVQQLYLSALMQMGAGTPEGQRPRVDIVGARQTIDLIGVLADKTRGNLVQDEERALQAVLFELRMTFLEITRAVTAGPLPPPPGR